MAIGWVEGGVESSICMHSLHWRKIYLSIYVWGWVSTKRLCVVGLGGGEDRLGEVKP